MTKAYEDFLSCFFPSVYTVFLVGLSASLPQALALSSLLLSCQGNKPGAVYVMQHLEHS